MIDPMNPAVTEQQLFYKKFNSLPLESFHELNILL